MKHVRLPLAAQDTPLHKAPAGGDKELVARLLAEGAEGRAEDCSDCTSVHRVVGKDKEPAARVACVAWQRYRSCRGEALIRI